MVDLLEGAPDLVAFGAVDAEVQRVVEHDRELTRVAAASAHTTGVGAGLVVLCTGMAMWAALALGVSAVHAGRLDGVFLAVVALIPLAAFELVSPLPVAARGTPGRAALGGSPLGGARPACGRQLSPPSRRRRGPGLTTTYVCGDSRVRHAPDAPWAVDGVDLDLSEGRRVRAPRAQAAPASPRSPRPSSASSTTSRVRFALDGTELRDFDSDQVRSVVGLVEQDAHIFDSTLRENMRLAKPSASDAEIMAALARPGCRTG